MDASPSLLLGKESKREAWRTLPAFVLLFMLPFLPSFLALCWLWDSAEALPVAASLAWERWANLWWLSALAVFLLPLASVAAQCLTDRFMGKRFASHRQATGRRFKSAERFLWEQLQEGEQPQAAVRITLPAPLHPLHSPLWHGIAEMPSQVGIVAATAFGSLIVALLGGFFEVPLSQQWQAILIALWLVCSLLPLMTESGGLSLFLRGLWAFVAASFGVMCFAFKLTQPATSFLGFALLGVAALNAAILLIRLLPLLRSPVSGLLVVTNRRVLMLGRRMRRWQVVSALTSDAPVRITLTARAVDALLHWQVGLETFTMTANLHEAKELRALLSERFPRWQWGGDIIEMPTWSERLKRDGMWRLALLLILSAWVGWVWHLSVLRFQVTFKLCLPPRENEVADRWLSRAQLAARLLPDEPLVSAARADALFAVGEWELMQRAWQRLPQSSYWKPHRKLLGIEAKWRAEVERRFAPKVGR